MSANAFQRYPLPILVALVIASCSREPSSGKTAAMDYPAPFVAVARGRVNVEGGLLNVAMPVEGTLTDVAVHEGERVRQGQTLAVTDPTASRIQLTMAQARLRQADVQQHLLESRLATSRVRAQRLAQAASAGAGDAQSADDAGDAVGQLAAERDASRAAASIAHAEVDQAQYLLDKQTLRAPVDAEVLKVAAQKGMSVSPQSGALFVLLPSRPYIIRAELNETFVSAVHAGMSAQISDDDGQTISATAHVLRIGSVFGPSTLLDEADTRVGERSVECVLALDGNSSLRVGQRVLVRFLPGQH
jgi:multidrug resistance efflux pump